MISKRSGKYDLPAYSELLQPYEGRQDDQGRNMAQARPRSDVMWISGCLPPTTFVFSVARYQPYSA